MRKRVLTKNHFYLLIVGTNLQSGMLYFVHSVIALKCKVPKEFSEISTREERHCGCVSII